MKLNAAIATMIRGGIKNHLFLPIVFIVLLIKSLLIRRIRIEGVPEDATQRIVCARLVWPQDRL